MKRIVLIRHGESQWNKENRFTGWTNVDLSEKGVQEALDAGKALKEAGITFEVAYTSYLKRAIKTLNNVLDAMDLDWIPVKKTWRLNEKHYGMLQGLNKAETAAKYGEDQVKIWRRSFDVRPPALEETDERNPRLMAPYRNAPADEMPLAECLKDTIARAWPYFEEEIEPQMRAGKRVLIVAHGNSLRALVKQFDKLSDDEIVGVNIPTGVPLVYTFDQDFNVLDKKYVGDEETINAKINAVANQGKAK